MIKKNFNFPDRISKNKCIIQGVFLPVFPDIYQMAGFLHVSS